MLQKKTYYLSVKAYKVGFNLIRHKWKDLHNISKEIDNTQNDIKAAHMTLNWLEWHNRLHMVIIYDNMQWKLYTWYRYDLFHSHLVIEVSLVLRFTGSIDSKSRRMICNLVACHNLYANTFHTAMYHCY